MEGLTRRNFLAITGMTLGLVTGTITKTIKGDNLALKKLNSLFPYLKSGKWGYINLEEESRNVNIDFTNPFLCENWIYELHKRKNIDYSFGGFLEERSNLWRNHYQKRTNSFVHLGIDYNVPVGTKVAMVRSGKVVHTMKDKYRIGGWGGRIIFELSDSDYLIFGHLKNDFSLKKGDVCNSKEVFGAVADKNENGGWYPHLHVQLVDKRFMGKFKGNLEKIDGYIERGHPYLEFILNPESII